MAASTPAVVSGKMVVMKPERPNEAAHREAETKAKKEIEDTQKKLVYLHHPQVHATQLTKGIG